MTYYTVHEIYNCILLNYTVDQIKDMIKGFEGIIKVKERQDFVQPKQEEST